MRRFNSTPLVTPQAPGRTPHRSALRLPGAETLLVRGTIPGPPRLPPEAREAPRADRPREAMK
jgi:hypothetical protein